MYSFPYSGKVFCIINKIYIGINYLELIAIRQKYSPLSIVSSSSPTTPILKIIRNHFKLTGQINIIKPNQSASAKKYKLNKHLKLKLILRHQTTDTSKQHNHRSQITNQRTKYKQLMIMGLKK